MQTKLILLTKEQRKEVILALADRTKVLKRSSELAALHCSDPAWGKKLKEMSLTCARIADALYDKG